MKFTLRQWQQMHKDPNEYIIQASSVDGQDRPTAMSIGMSYCIGEYKDKLHTIQHGPHNNLALCAISENTDQRRRGPVRKTILERLKVNNIENVKLEPDKYFKLLPSYKFVISPEGNGIDCHRHYEALMAGCIPVIEHNPLIAVKYGNAPILWTTDYSEITPEYLETKYKEYMDKTWDFSLLYLSGWSPEEQLLAKYRGNFWMEKLTGTPWYPKDQLQIGAIVKSAKLLFLQVGEYEYKQ